jgi:hypothetical protein
MKAKPADAPALAWTLALAFTRLDGVDRPFRAALEYLLQMAAIIGPLTGGRLFHQNRMVMVVLADPRKTQILPGLAGSVVFLIPMVLIMVVLPITTGSWAATGVGLMLLFVSLGPALIRMLKPETRRAERILKETVEALPKDRMVYTYSLLARGLEAAPGSGQQLLARVLEENVPDDALIACVAADRNLIPVYARFGLRPLQDSLAMLTPETNRTVSNTKRPFSLPPGERTLGESRSGRDIGGAHG